MARASQIQEDNLCIWKYISNGANKVEGRLERCDKECDGYRTTCEYYINHGKIKARQDRN